MQVVGYETDVRAAGPALLFGDGDAVRHEPLSAGRDLAYSLGPRRCAGVIVDGDHRPCDVPVGPYCEAHASTWVCARCTGTCLKEEMDCHEDHAVYLAAFAPATFKVGVTRSWRLETRLREQGADRAAHIHTVSNGRIARQREAEIAERIPDRVRVPTKIRGSHRSVDGAAWEALLDDFDVIERFAFEYGLDPTDRPVAETILTGTVRGTKGRMLALERGATTYGVDMRDLVGHELTAEPTDRELQSTLGAFG